MMNFDMMKNHCSMHFNCDLFQRNITNLLVRNYLDEDCKDNDSNAGGDKKFFTKNSVWKSEGQCKRYSSSKATVGQTKLVFEIEWDGAEGVNYLCQYQDAYKTRDI